MTMLQDLLKKGDDLIALHRAEIPILAMDFLRSQCLEEIAALAAESPRPSFNLNEEKLGPLPVGSVCYPIYASPNRRLGEIRLFINTDSAGNDDPPIPVTGYVELHTSKTHYERVPISEVNLDWLIVGLKRADGCVAYR